MEDDFRKALRARYYVPVRKNIILISVMVIAFYVIVVSGASSGAKDGFLEFLGKREGGETVAVSMGALYFWLAIALGFFYLLFLFRLLRYKIHYKKDAEFGQIVKEKVHVTDVVYTPAGINIYWLDSESILTFTPEPYYHFKVGDSVAIYYLKYSKEYLAYDFS
ncbi:hypothetical protein DN068_13730 [Taibaiella soli]|uniref:Uncharacterized protein n=2 Tax=Taibaiella soli TaxID=1649169 RepID=A0A2W2AXL3_9BACT|nr:hypothetical protein DN068_13730 [Taibaiella soli]